MWDPLFPFQGMGMFGEHCRWVFSREPHKVLDTGAGPGLVALPPVRGPESSRAAFGVGLLKLDSVPDT